jgi:FXSXX-COOH protein
MDEHWIVSDLPDLTDWTLAQLLASDDTELRAAIERIVRDVLSRPPQDGCGC